MCFADIEGSIVDYTLPKANTRNNSNKFTTLIGIFCAGTNK